MNGPEFLAQIAKTPVLSELKVVLMSAGDQFIDKGQTAGLVGRLKKPVVLDDLFALVGLHCS